MESRFASPVPARSFDIGSLPRQKNNSGRHLGAALPATSSKTPQIIKADGYTYGNQPKCLLMNFDCHGDDSPFRPPTCRAEFITLGPG